MGSRTKSWERGGDREGGCLTTRIRSIRKSSFSLSRPIAPEARGATTTATCQVRLVGRQINLAVSRHVTVAGHTTGRCGAARQTHIDLFFFFDRLFDERIHGAGWCQARLGLKARWTDSNGGRRVGGGDDGGRAGGAALVTTEIPHRLTDETWREQHLDQPVHRDVAQRRATDR